MVSTVEAGGHVCVMGSEEVEEPIQIPLQYPQGKYVLQFDPLDGSAPTRHNGLVPRNSALIVIPMG